MTDTEARALERRLRADPDDFALRRRVEAAKARIEYPLIRWRCELAMVWQLRERETFQQEPGSFIDFGFAFRYDGTQFSIVAWDSRHAKSASGILPLGGYFLPAQEFPFVFYASPDVPGRLEAWWHEDPATRIARRIIDLVRWAADPKKEVICFGCRARTHTVVEQHDGGCVEVLDTPGWRFSESARGHTNYLRPFAYCGPCWERYALCDLCKQREGYHNEGDLYLCQTCYVEEGYDCDSDPGA